MREQNIIFIGVFSDYDASKYSNKYYVLDYKI